MMKNSDKSFWFCLFGCIFVSILFIAVPSLMAHTTRSNGLGAGLFVITLRYGLPIASLICGLLSAAAYKKLRILPALPTAVYLLCFPFIPLTNLSFGLAQFFGLIIGYGVFGLAIYILKNRKQRRG